MRLRRPRLPSFSALASALSARLAVSGNGPFRTRVVVPVVLLALVGGLVPITLVATRPDIQVRGLSAGAVISKAELDGLSVRVAADGARPDDLRVHLDGEPVQAQRKMTPSSSTSPKSLTGGIP